MTNSETQTVAIGYVRVSTGKQLKSGLSLENQQFEIMNYCTQNNYILKEIYSEQASGGNNEREILADVIDYAKKNKCKLIVSKLDRLARNTRKTIELFDEVDIEVVEFGGKVQGIMLAVLGSVAQMELESITERNNKRIATMKRRNIEAGLPENNGMGNDYFKGKQNETVKAGRLKGVKKRVDKAFEKHSHTVGILKLIYKDIGYKPKEMSNKLYNDFKITNTENKPLTVQQVAYLFKRYISCELQNVSTDVLNIIPTGFSVKEYAENHTVIYCALLQKKGFSLGQIARHLNGNFVKTRAGNKYHAQTIKRILETVEV